MHVRKFQGETIEETLKQIKKELGPDAIILKTTTNRGIKGAFKRSRVEVTAAITEKTYLKKATLETAVGNDNVDSLSNQSASYLSELIDDYDQKTSGRSSVKNNSGYGNLGLNKRVNDKTELDSFLNNDQNKAEAVAPVSSVNEFITSPSTTSQSESISSQLGPFEKTESVEKRELRYENNSNERSDEQILGLKEEINQLKELVNEISLKDIDQKAEKSIDEKHFIQSIYTLLKSSGLNERFLHENIKEFISQNSNGNEDELIDHVIKKIQGNLKVDEGLLESSAPGVNLFFGIKNSGQTMLVRKLAAKQKGSELIVYGEEDESFGRKISGVSTHYSRSVAEVISIARKIVEKGNNAIVDINLNEIEPEDVASICDYCTNNFEVFRSFLTLNSIHTESINLRLIKKYKNFASVINFTHVDLCLDWGSIFNCMYLEDVPISYLSRGININSGVERITDETLLNNLLA